MDAVLQDLRYAIRNLRRTPGFTLIAALTLALGIGPNTAIFSLIYGLMLRPLPYQDPGKLVVGTWAFQQGQAMNGVTTAEYTWWAQHQQVFSGMAAATSEGAGYNLELAGQPEYVRGQRVSVGLFPVLGVRPAAGRWFLAGEDQRGGPPAVIISWALWQRRFGGSPDAIGRIIPLNGGSYPIVGVLPSGFTFESAGVDVWLPLWLQVNPGDQGHNTMLVARLAPGISLEQAQAQMPRMLAEFDRELPGHVTKGERGMFLQPLRDVMIEDIRPIVLLLFGAVALVVLIAVANATGLLLGRATSRRHEVAVRAALGASRWALMRAMIAEGVVLAIAGAAVGLLLARWTLDLVNRAVSGNADVLSVTSLDLPVLLMTLVLSLIVGTVVGVIPALQRPANNVSSTLQETARAGSGRQFWRTGLVVGEVALSTVLLAGAVLLMVSISRLWSVSPGFDTAGVTVIQTSLPGGKFATTEAVGQFESRVIERVSRLPGVTLAAAASSTPLERGLNGGVWGVRHGKQVSEYTEGRVVGPGYFATLGIPVLRGRAFDETDRASSAQVVIINKALARRFFGDEDPIGQTIGYESRQRLVVGVVADILDRRLDQPATQTLYMPQAQESDQMSVLINGWFLTSFIVRSRAPLDRVSFERVMADVDPAQPVASVRTMEEITAGWLAPRRLVGLLLEVFAFLAVVLAGIGLYGVIAFAVNQRRREIGLRMALGATRNEVMHLVLGQGFRLSFLGAGIGVVAAFLSTRFLRTMLFGVQATNPVVLGVAAVDLVVVALIASYLPARRAARVDPMVALRAE